MIEKSSSHRISSTELKSRLGHWLDEAVQGEEVVVTRHGKPEVSLGAIQKNLPLMGLPEKQIKKFYTLVDSLETEDLALVIQFVRQLLENKLAGKNEKK